MNFAALGIKVKLDGPVEQRPPCPKCERLGPFSIDIRSGKFNCFRCNFSGRVAGDYQARAVHAPTKHSTLSDYGRALWSECRELGGTAAEYLKARHCVIPPADGDLRWHPRLKHFSGYEGPALVALVTDAITCKPLSLHRSWIKADGTKAPINPPRMLLKGHKKAGGVIRLWPDESVTLSLAVAEGIETSLCAAHGHTPMWSLIDAGNMQNFPLLAGIENLLIFADHDSPGLAAATACANRWAHHAEVIVVKPELPGTDWADAVAA